jgi:hypothetical protein
MRRIAWLWLGPWFIVLAAVAYVQTIASRP